MMVWASVSHIGTEDPLGNLEFAWMPRCLAIR